MRKYKFHPIRKAKRIRAIEAKHQDIRFIKDPKGFFLIKVEHGSIVVGICTNKYLLNRTVAGSKCQDIYYTIINKGWISRLDHAAYLGKELKKAELALQHGWKYFQE